jgi:hypothetical protein
MQKKGNKKSVCVCVCVSVCEWVCLVFPVGLVPKSRQRKFKNVSGAKRLIAYGELFKS